ncbi:hypothetical protein [Corallococcus llansteffanensis]|uniref:Uncharacterized protein n=1 Tax=Corallococcus llansteffanensis TaxID=2316731 RepID=A0A3A8QF60_9BACT|nr:hypothetical protein [Corallococcus llansteffanensis]RKH67307.1 hypothetical protein D7V93_03225 [Corallococcus llansteffanensis]
MGPDARHVPHLGVAALLIALALGASACGHAQRPERKTYVVSEDALGVGTAEGPGTGGSGAEAYCNEMEKQCFQKCWRRKPSVTSIPKHSGMHNVFCTQLCREEFMKCVEEQEELERQDAKQELQFPNMGTAMNWLREHKSEVALGTVVVVAGVAFTLVVAPAGLLILSPI